MPLLNYRDFESQQVHDSGGLVKESAGDKMVLHFAVGACDLWIPDEGAFHLIANIVGIFFKNFGSNHKIGGGFAVPKSKGAYYEPVSSASCQQGPSESLPDRVPNTTAVDASFALMLRLSRPFPTGKGFHVKKHSLFPLPKGNVPFKGDASLMSTQKPKHRFWRGKVLPKLLLTVVPLPKNTFCSIDVTSQCNLRCKHCYFFSYDQNKGPELPVDEWLHRIETMQKGRGAFFSCTWVGGEPLLRCEFIEQGKKFFRSNRVVTNGTLALPEWQDVEFHISIDGTQKLHDAIRGNGCYDRIKQNISSPKYANLKIAIACCLSSTNIGCIRDLVEEWRQIKHIRHILFDFFTPIRGVNEKIWIDFDERDKTLDKLEKLKNEFGDFIGGPPHTFQLMRKANRHQAIGKNCVFLNNGTSFDVWGNIKKPCVIGPQADCDRCGCIVPFSVKAWKRPSNLLREIWRDFEASHS